MNFYFDDERIHELSVEDVVTKFQTSLSQGLSRTVAMKQRELKGMNRVTPPVNCPTWVCCLLPCVFRTESMRLFHQTLPQEAMVVRNKRKICMDASSLVCGDVVSLGSGDVVPADCRIVHCSSDFQVDMSVLGISESLRYGTSEQTQVGSPIHSKNMLFMASSVVQGEATVIVVAVGDDTIWGQLIQSRGWPQSYNIEKAPLVLSNTNSNLTDL